MTEITEAELAEMEEAHCPYHYGEGLKWCDEDTCPNPWPCPTMRLIAAYREQSAELKQYKQSAPLCGKHQPVSGWRTGCLVCALQSDSRALSKIDYMCGKPNEMELSSYDVSYNEGAVVEHVKALVAENVRLRSENDALSDSAASFLNELV